MLCVEKCVRRRDVGNAYTSAVELVFRVPAAGARSNDESRKNHAERATERGREREIISGTVHRLRCEMAEMDLNKAQKTNLVEQKHYDECCCTFFCVDCNSHHSHRLARRLCSHCTKPANEVQQKWDENRKQQNAAWTLQKKRPNLPEIIFNTKHLLRKYIYGIQTKQQQQRRRWNAKEILRQCAALERETEACAHRRWKMEMMEMEIEWRECKEWTRKKRRTEKSISHKKMNVLSS